MTCGKVEREAGKILEADCKSTGISGEEFENPSLKNVTSLKDFKSTVIVENVQQGHKCIEFHWTKQVTDVQPGVCSKVMGECQRKSTDL